MTSAAGTFHKHCPNNHMYMYDVLARPTTSASGHGSLGTLT
jgi:hypothetical protein